MTNPRTGYQTAHHISWGPCEKRVGVRGSKLKRLVQEAISDERPASLWASLFKARTATGLLFTGVAPCGHCREDMAGCQHEFGLQFFPARFLDPARESGMIGADLM